MAQDTLTLADNPDRGGLLVNLVAKSCLLKLLSAAHLVVLILVAL